MKYKNQIKLPRPNGRGIFSPRSVGSKIPPKRNILRSRPRANALGVSRRGIKIIFNKTKKVSCPAFAGETVHLNSKGLSHIFYKGSDKKFTRSHKEARVRVLLIPQAIEVLKKATYFQEERSYTVNNKKTRFWAFEVVTDNHRIKVIVRQIGQGQKHFWSVIPAWRRVRGKIVNAKGDLSKL